MPDWLVQVIVLLTTGGALYGGIRADLVRALDTARRAHERIDEHLGDHLRGQLARGMGG